MSRTDPEAWLMSVREKLDHTDPLELLNDPDLRAFCRALANKAGGTRGDLVAQGFTLAATLERERFITQLAQGTWPGHEDPRSGHRAIQA